MRVSEALLDFVLVVLSVVVLVVVVVSVSISEQGSVDLSVPVFNGAGVGPGVVSATIGAGVVVHKDADRICNNKS